jgi:hypothetical protein
MRRDRAAAQVGRSHFLTPRPEHLCAPTDRVTDFHHMRRVSLSIAALALLGVGCRSEVPSPATLCWNGPSAAGQNPFNNNCEPELCFQKVQRDTLTGVSWLCPRWSEVTPQTLSTDANPQDLQFVYAEGVGSVAHFISVHFDNRVAIDPSLEKFQKYVLDASGTYETYQGEMKFNTTDVEVLDYDAGKLKVRIHATFDRILYAGLDLSASLDVCTYHPEGTDPVLGQLVLDVDAPIDTRPLSP